MHVLHAGSIIFYGRMTCPNWIVFFLNSRGVLLCAAGSETSEEVTSSQAWRIAQVVLAVCFRCQRYEKLV